MFAPTLVNSDESVDLSNLSDPVIIRNGSPLPLEQSDSPLSPHRMREFVFAPFNTIGSFMTTFVVPPAPASFDPQEQLIFLFPAVQADTTEILLQPVLQFGFNDVFGGPFWQISSWVVSLNQWSFYSQPIVVESGHVIQAQMISQESAGLRNWTVITTDLTQAAATQLSLVKVPADLFVGGMVIGGQLEAYAIAECANLPGGDRQTVFSGIVVTDGDGVIMNPQLEWMIAPAASRFTGCTMGVSFDKTPDTTSVTVQY